MNYKAAQEQYKPYRENKMETGRIYQDFITDLLSAQLGIHIQQYSSRLYQMEVGESKQGIEIKHDEKLIKTGNLWIEVAEKAQPRAGEYFPSGIYSDNNSWLYVIGDYDIVFIFTVKFLKRLSTNPRYPIIENNTKTSRGYLLKKIEAEQFAEIILLPKAAEKVKKHVLDLEGLGQELHREILRDARQRCLFQEEETDN